MKISKSVLINIATFIGLLIFWYEFTQMLIPIIHPKNGTQKQDQTNFEGWLHQPKYRAGGITK